MNKDDTKSLTARVRKDLADQADQARGHLSWNQYIKYLVIKDVDPEYPHVPHMLPAISHLDPTVLPDADRIAQMVRGK